MKSIILLSLFLISAVSYAQIDLESQVPQEKKYDNSIVDETYGIQLYEPLNMVLEGDSVRMENGYAVNNWKEDFYNDGTLLHRGYYIDGQLKVYKNYYPNGQIEREFKKKKRVGYLRDAQRAEIEHMIEILCPVEKVKTQ